ncbi:NET1-associated nuclear protein 1 [Massospora cicadina]|nr:NET1-associated nuclear protein 1 [Massospora cicadina]
MPILNILSIEELALDGSLAPAYSLSSDTIFVPEPGLVDVVNLKTSMRVARFEPPASAPIVSCGPVYSSPTQIFVASEDGSICIWDYKTHKPVHEWRLPSSIHKVCTTPASPNRLFVLISVSGQYEVLVVEMDASSSMAQEAIQEHPAFMPLRDQRLFLLGSIPVSPAFYLEVHQTIGSLGVVLATPSEKWADNIFFLDFIKFQSVPYYRVSQVFSPPPVNGPILLAKLVSHKGGGDKLLEMMPSKLHWHANGPTSLRFSPDGLSLLSGGDEATLVMWTLDTLERSFVPRLRSPIGHIATAHDQSSYLIRFQDGTLTSIDPSTQRPAQTWAGATRSDRLSFKPTIEPSSNLLCLPGHPGWVGFYNLELSQMVKELDPVKLNRVTGEDAPPSVDVVTFSPHGRWMVVSVSIPTKLVRPEIHFQVWALAPPSQRDYGHVLTTQVWDSHAAPVVAVAFGSSESSFASLGRDGILKLWAHAEGMGPTELGPVFSKLRRAVPIPGIYALAMTLALWDPQSLCLRQYLACPSAGGFTCAQFVRDTPFLAALGSERVVVFNLLSGSVWWSLPLAPMPGLLLVDGRSASFSVVGPQDLLLTFDPSCPEPLFATRLPFTPVALVGLPFSKAPNCLLAVSTAMTVVRLSSEQAAGSPPKASDVPVDATFEVAAEFRPLEIHQPLKKAAIKPSGVISAVQVGLGDDFNRALQIPSHVAPPAKHMLGDFMLAMFAKSQPPPLRPLPPPTYQLL